MVTQKMDISQIIAVLTPTASVSRTGKMADMALPTHNLCKSGQAAFLPRKQKRTKTGIIAAEVVDAQLLDPFGTAQPRCDKGRTNELVSSPREHPQITAKAEAMLAPQGKSLLTIAEEDPAEKEKTEEKERAERHRMMFVMDDDDDASSSKKATGGSACFRTVQRDKAPKAQNLYTPEVGHYRPRFGVVERRSVSPYLPRNGIPERRSKKKKGKRGRVAASSPVSAPTPTIASLDSPSQQRWPFTPPPGSPTRGSPCFLSKVANRAPIVDKTSEIVYGSLNEGMLSTYKGGKSGFVEFAHMLSRDDQTPSLLLRTAMEGSPDVVYNVKVPTRSASPGASYDMAKAPQRGLGVLPKVLNPATNMDYQTELKRKIQTPNFKKSLGREQTSAQRAMIAKANEATSELDINCLEVESTHKRAPTSPDFEKQLPRPDFLNSTPNDLTYNVNLGSVLPRTRFVDMSKPSPGHVGFFTDSYTTKCDYNPNVECIGKSTTGTRDLGRTPNREQMHVGFQAKVGCATVDSFYDTDSELVRPRVKGNPMMKSHLSRDERNNALKQKTHCPDVVYEYSVERTLPKTTGINLMFGKMTGRDTKGGGRMLSTADPPIPSKASGDTFDAKKFMQTL